MEKTSKHNELTYNKWLGVISIVSGLAGWIVQGVLSGEFVYWALPLSWIGTAAYTINGDNIIESIVVLVMLGFPAVIFGSSDSVVAKIGVGTIPGIYVALVLSKITFALAKKGFFGNQGFS